jgi:hypothetical protein
VAALRAVLFVRGGGGAVPPCRPGCSNTAQQTHPRAAARPSGAVPNGGSMEHGFVPNRQPVKPSALTKMRASSLSPPAYLGGGGWGRRCGGAGGFGATRPVLPVQVVQPSHFGVLDPILLASHSHPNGLPLQHRSGERCRGNHIAARRRRAGGGRGARSPACAGRRCAGGGRDATHTHTHTASGAAARLRQGFPRLARDPPVGRRERSRRRPHHHRTAGPKRRGAARPERGRGGPCRNLWPNELGTRDHHHCRPREESDPGW